MKLSTSYNIETIIAPLDVQISEAIMNFQENASNISQHVFQVCGRAVSASELHQLPLGRPAIRLGKRAADLNPSTASISNHNRQYSAPIVTPHHPTAGLTLSGHLRAAAAKEGLVPRASLLPDDLAQIGQKSPMLIDEIKAYMLSTKNFWPSLPNAVCTSNYTLGSNATNSAISARRQQVNSNCFQEPFGLSDINSDLRYRVEIHQLVLKLDFVRSRIDDALAGVEIDWSSNLDQARQTIVAPNLHLNGRLPLSTTTTTTTTSTTSEPIGDESEEDDDSIESGSGDDLNVDSEYSPTEFDNDSESIDDTETDGTTDVADSDHDTNEQNSEISGEESAPSSPVSQNNGDELASSPQPTLDNQDNTIDQIIQTNSLDTQLNLITPPNQAGAQKSGQTSNKLVIDIESNLLFTSTCVMSVALLIVTNFNHILTQQRP